MQIKFQQTFEDNSRTLKELLKRQTDNLNKAFKVFELQKEGLRTLRKKYDCVYKDAENNDATIMKMKDDNMEQFNKVRLDKLFEKQKNYQ